MLKKISKYIFIFSLSIYALFNIIFTIIKQELINIDNEKNREL